MGKNCTDFILSFYYFLRRRWSSGTWEGLAAVERLDAEAFRRAPHELLVKVRAFEVGNDFVLPCLFRHRSKISLQIQFCCHDLSVNLIYVDVFDVSFDWLPWAFFFLSRSSLERLFASKFSDALIVPFYCLFICLFICPFYCLFYCLFIGVARAVAFAFSLYWAVVDFYFSFQLAKKIKNEKVEI